MTMPAKSIACIALVLGVYLFVISFETMNVAQAIAGILLVGASLSWFFPRDRNL